MIVPTLPNRTQVVRPVEPFPAVDADLRRHRLVPHVAQPGQYVGEPSGPVLQPAIGVSDHLGVESGPGHHGEVFVVQLAEVEPPARTVEGYAHGLRKVGRDTEVSGELVRGAGWDHRNGGVRAGEGVHTPLNHAVAAPHEYQIDAVLDRAAGRLARLAALGHLVPDGFVEPFVGDQLPEFVEAAAEGLLPVGDDGDPSWWFQTGVDGRRRSEIRAFHAHVSRPVVVQQQQAVAAQQQRAGQPTAPLQRQSCSADELARDSATAHRALFLHRTVPRSQRVG